MPLKSFGLGGQELPACSIRQAYIQHRCICAAFLRECKPQSTTRLSSSWIRKWFESGRTEQHRLVIGESRYGACSRTCKSANNLAPVWLMTAPRFLCFGSVHSHFLFLRFVFHFQLKTNNSQRDALIHTYITYSRSPWSRFLDFMGMGCRPASGHCALWCCVFFFLSSFLFLTPCLFLERRSVTGVKIHGVGQDGASFISTANKTDLARGVRFFTGCLVLSL